MIKRADFIALIVVTILISYAMIATTMNGVLTPDFRLPTLGVMGVTVGVWLLLHWRRGWVLHHTPLDGVMVLWVIAFVISLIANLESWRRIAIGLWYVVAYIGVWYLLHDLLANKAVSRETLVDGLLITGIVILIFGFVQARVWLTQTLPLIVSGNLAFSLPRPVSTFGNPNTLANFLLVLIPFVLVRLLSARVLVGRITMGIYACLALLLLFLTYSRGAWIGAAVAALVAGVLLVAQRNLLSRRALAAWWVQRGSLARTLAAAILVGGFAVGLFAFLIFIDSFRESGRSTGLRTDIYQTALTMFAEKPLTGHGLFTFGRGLARLQSVPPTTPHSHAHDAPLHIAAELGILGLTALTGTLFVMFRAAWRNWQSIADRQRMSLSAAIAAVVGFGVHQLTDIPAMTPAVALVGLLALALMMTSVNPVPLVSTVRQWGHLLAVGGLWAVLLLAGFWSSRVYIDYVSLLSYASRTNDFRGAADQLEAVLAADPGINLYYKEQGLLLGLAAFEGDENAAQDALAAYEHFLTTDPDYAVVWVNVAALQWGRGDRESALASMERAVALAPEAWQFAVNLGNYAGALGRGELARQAYESAVAVYPDITLLPEFEQFYDDGLELTIPARVVKLLGGGQVNEAVQVWAQNPQPGSASKFVMDALLALGLDDRVNAEDALAIAQDLAVNDIDRQWVLLGQVALSRFDRDDHAALAALELMRHEVFDADFSDGINIAYQQFLRYGFPRQFLPQVYYPVDDPVLLYLIQNT